MDYQPLYFNTIAAGVDRAIMVEDAGASPAIVTVAAVLAACTRLCDELLSIPSAAERENALYDLIDRFEIRPHGSPLVAIERQDRASHA